MFSLFLVFGANTVFDRAEFLVVLSKEEEEEEERLNGVCEVVFGLKEDSLSGVWKDDKFLEA